MCALARFDVRAQVPFDVRAYMRFYARAYVPLCVWLHVHLDVRS